MKIKFLKANNGDSILISFSDTKNGKRNILIDGGPGKTYEFKNKKEKRTAGDLQIVISEIKERKEKIDLLILTHVDDDHIGGILKWFQKDKEAKKFIDEVWFNSGRTIFKEFGKDDIKENLIPLNIERNTNTSIGQGVTFEDYIENNNLWKKEVIKVGQQIEKYGLTFKILSPSDENLKNLLRKWKKEKPKTLTSPNKNDYSYTINQLIDADTFAEDNAIHNGSSISFILTYRDKYFLFLSDSHPNTIINSLALLKYTTKKPIKAELVKISHHGSKANTSYELLNMIDSENFIISSNGDVHALPDKRTLSRIINHSNNVNLHFNYEEMIARIFNLEDYIAFPNFKAVPIKKEFIIE